MTNSIIQLQTDSGTIGAVLYEPVLKKSEAFVVFFHGRGEYGDGSNATLQALAGNGNHANLLKFADKYGFRVVAPQVNTKLTNGNLWWSVPHIRAILKSALTLTALPKLIVSGLSQGGGTTWQALTDAQCAPLIFGAIAICPTAQYEGDFSLITKYGIAVRNFHAADDGTVGVASSRNMVAKANSFSPNPKVNYIEYKTGNHYIWGTAYNTEEMYPELLAYAPTGAASPAPVPVPADEILSTYKLTNYKSGNTTLEKM